MTAQLEALTAEVARNTKATQALAEAVAKIPATTPPEDITPVINQLKANNDAIEAATASLVAMAPPAEPLLAGRVIDVSAGDSTHAAAK